VRLAKEAEAKRKQRAGTASGAPRQPSTDHSRSVATPVDDSQSIETPMDDLQSVETPADERAVDSSMPEVTAPQQKAIPPIPVVSFLGRDERIFFESLDHFPELLRSPNRSTTSLASAMIEIRAAMRREGGVGSMLVKMIGERRTVMEDLLKRFELEAKILRLQDCMDDERRKEKAEELKNQSEN